MKKIFLSILSLVIVAGFLFVLPVFRASASQEKYDYQYIEQSAYPDVMAPGESVYVWIEIKNTGTSSWFDSGNNITRLGSGSKYGANNQGRDYSSEFSNSRWLSNNRPTKLQVSEVKPGETASFAFLITAPTQIGTYKAYFTPVVDGVTWMKDIGIYWQIRSEQTGTMSVNEARTIAQNASICTQNTALPNATLDDIYMYNSGSKTWWVNINRNVRDGCSPACVVDEATRTADVNWRCTGAL